MKTFISRLAVLTLAAALPAAALEVVHPEDQSGDVYLAPAPWLDPETPPSPPAMRSKAVSAVGPINTFNSSAVVAAYNAYYNLPEPAVNFTGSVASCIPGGISLAFQEWTITRINYLRAMAGVPGNTTLDSSLNAQQQAAALIMSANNTLTHSPSPGMACYTALGASGAGSSNIALGSFTDSIPLYMSDPGVGNEAAGHRRWILHSAKNSFGLGQTTPPGGSALSTFQFGSAVAAPNGIPWPPRGYVPIALFPTAFTSIQRWSFGLPGANFGSANVTLARNGVAVPVTVISRTANGYGDNTMVWELPNGHSVTAGSVYDVSITGVSSASGSTFKYQVLPINPASNSADLALSHVAAPATGGTGKDVVYTLNVSNAGPVAAANIALTDTLPPGTTVIWLSPGCANVAGTVTCSLGTLASGASRQVKLVVRPSSAGTITNNASVSSGAPDSNSANNASAASTTISTSPLGLAVFRYRLYSPVTKEHHFTTDINEYATLGTQVGTWQQEGTSGKVLNNPGSVAGVTAVPYYRLYNTGTAWHHWTTDANEYYTLSTVPGWNAEGVDGYILPTMATGATQLYRLVYPQVAGGLHHWTIDANEYTTLINSYGWVGEGGSGYVLQ